MNRPDDALESLGLATIIMIGIVVGLMLAVLA